MNMKDQIINELKDDIESVKEAFKLMEESITKGVNKGHSIERATYAGYLTMCGYLKKFFKKHDIEGPFSGDS